jgi:hypothetical protein
MRIYAVLVIFVLTIFVTPCLSQQVNPTTTIVARDAKAIGLVQTIVQALGGTSFYSATSGVVARGTLTSASGAISGPIVWEWAGTEFRYSRPGPSGSIIFVSGHGNPAIIEGSVIRRGIGHLAMVTYPFHVPSVVLGTLLKNQNVSISSMQTLSLDGVSATAISFVDQTDELSSVICRQTWYFNPQTLVPIRVDYLTSDANNALNTIQESILLSDFRNVSGISIPFHMITFFNGQQIEDTVFTLVEIGPVPNAEFDLTASASGVPQ